MIPLSEAAETWSIKRLQSSESRFKEKLFNCDLERRGCRAGSWNRHPLEDNQRCGEMNDHNENQIISTIRIIAFFVWSVGPEVHTHTHTHDFSVYVEFWPWFSPLCVVSKNLSARLWAGDRRRRNGTTCWHFKRRHHSWPFRWSFALSVSALLLKEEKKSLCSCCIIPRIHTWTICSACSAVRPSFISTEKSEQEKLWMIRHIFIYYIWSL